jgi:hypothetical protein
MAVHNTKVVTGKIRMNYPNLFTPRAVNEGDEPKYSLCVLIPKSDRETLDKIRSAVETAKGAGKRVWGEALPEGLMLPLKDGDKEHPDQAEYAGHFFFNTSSKLKPGIIDMERNEVTDSAEIYSGCYGRASVSFYPFNVSENKGIGCKLLNVQKLADGQALAVRSTAQEDFAEDIDEEFPW